MSDDQSSIMSDIVISGISGRFPSSDSVQEFKENLFNGVDMVTADETRWPLGESLCLSPAATSSRDFVSLLALSPLRVTLTSCFKPPFP